MNPHAVTKSFEAGLAEYTGAPYAVCTTSCTMALFLSLQWIKASRGLPDAVQCPKYTYVGVPMQLLHCGVDVQWTDEQWGERGYYDLSPTPVRDSARLLTSDMYEAGTLTCLSMHWGKTLGLSQGGCILTDDADAYAWLKRARFDGRTEGVAPKNDDFQVGWHAYLSPEISAHGIVKLSLLAKHNDPLPPDDYPDLSRARVFGGTND